MFILVTGYLPVLHCDLLVSVRGVCFRFLSFWYLPAACVCVCVFGLGFGDFRTDMGPTTYQPISSAYVIVL